ncbi:MAG: glycosyltransferase [Treponema sp.]|nr:glycosyltransferase [Treponema sp.]
MNYISVYCYYSPTGDVSRDALLLLKELKTVSNYIIVVANGLLNSNSFDSLADEVFVRENYSFDFGAYRFAFENSNLNNILNEADGLILCNSSFFGPFVPLKDLFDKMSSSPCDFWGISSFEKGFSKHIQSYFLVYKKAVLSSGLLQQYFRINNKEDMDYDEVCSIFEQGLFDFLICHHYTYDACFRDILCDMYANPYGSLKIDKLPLLKKRFFTDNFYNRTQAIKALWFIKEKFHYDITDLLYTANHDYNRLIYESDLNKDVQFIDFYTDKHYVTREAIIGFIKKNTKIYIYGSGLDALHIYNIFFLSRNNKAFGGFITDGKGSCSFENKDFSFFDLIDIPHDAAIINACDFDYKENAIEALKGYSNVMSCWSAQVSYTVSITESMSDALLKYNTNGNFPLAVLDSSNIPCGIISHTELELFSQNLTASISESYSPGYSFFDKDCLDSIEECRIFAETDIDVFPVINSEGNVTEFRSRLFPSFMYSKLLNFVECSKKYRFRYIYGAGEYGRCSAEILERAGFKTDAFLVTENNSLEAVRGIQVVSINSVALDEEDTIILIALKPKFRDEVVALLKQRGFTNYISLTALDFTDVEDFGISRKIWKKQSGMKFPRQLKYSFILCGSCFSLDEDLFTIKSILAQSYQDWELLVSGKNILPQLDIVCLSDKRIKYVGLSPEQCINQAEGDYIIYIDNPVMFHPAFLYESSKKICRTNADLIYADDVYITSLSLHGDSKTAFKPDFSIDYLRSYNYIGSCFVFNRNMMDADCFINEKLNSYSLLLRLSEKTARIVHIPKILSYYDSQIKNPDKDSDFIALQKHLSRCNLDATVTEGNVPETYHISYAIIGNPLISILIPSFDHAGTLKKCIDSIIQKTTYKNYEIIIVENNSVERETFSYYENLSNFENVHVVTWKECFNFSEINNYGFSFSKGDYIVLLNNDTEIINGNWLGEMLMFAQRKDVGAVGAKLIYPSGKIQHGGVFLGIGGIAGHSHRNYSRDAPGYENRLVTVQNLCAVTGACMMVPRAVFESVGGMTSDFEVAFNDVDLCMKIRKQGYNVVWTPYASLFHFESESRGPDNLPQTIERFKSERYLFSELWGNELQAGDPFYNPNLTLETEDMACKNLSDSVFHD